MNQNNKWYHFGRWVEPVISSGIFLDFRNTEAFTITGLNFFGEIRQLDGHYFLHKKDIDRVVEFVKEKIEKNIKWFKDFFKLCDKKLRGVADLAGGNDLEKIFKIIVEAANCSMAIEFLDIGLERYIEKICKTKGIRSSNILSKMKPHKKTLLMQYQKELMNLKNENIKDFVKKWEWVGTHFFMGNPLTGRKVKKELMNMKQKIEKKKNIIPIGFETILEIGSKMAFYRSFIMEQIDKITYEYWPIIRKIGEDNGLKWDEIILLNHYEIIKLRDNKVLPNNFKERKRGHGTINSNGKIRVITGDQLKRALEECEGKVNATGVTEIKGMVAHRSDKKVKGIVKIVEESKYISKINKGDILVANETTPDYVVGMKIAGAIITNQGGITCHAAIVSRELGIPCIIGTKIATKTLKDGDFVEVDAEKGAVKILKKSLINIIKNK